MGFWIAFREIKMQNTARWYRWQIHANPGKKLAWSSSFFWLACGTTSCVSPSKPAVAEAAAATKPRRPPIAPIAPIAPAGLTGVAPVAGAGAAATAGCSSLSSDDSSCKAAPEKIKTKSSPRLFQQTRYRKG